MPPQESKEMEGLAAETISLQECPVLQIGTVADTSQLQEGLELHDAAGDTTPLLESHEKERLDADINLLQESPVLQDEVEATMQLQGGLELQDNKKETAANPQDAVAEVGKQQAKVEADQLRSRTAVTTQSAEQKVQVSTVTEAKYASPTLPVGSSAGGGTGHELYEIAADTTPLRKSHVDSLSPDTMEPGTEIPIVSLQDTM